MDRLLRYAGSGLTVLWGIAHLIPTRSVARRFGDISADNRRIVNMEWIAEGIMLIFAGLLVISVTAMDPSSGISTVVYFLSVLTLLAMAMVSLFTGYRVDFLPFRLCPVILTLSAGLITAGWIIT